jgi:hypothetical protein
MNPQTTMTIRKAATEAILPFARRDEMGEVHPEMLATKFGTMMITVMAVRRCMIRPSRLNV